MHAPLTVAPKRRKPTQSRARATAQAIEQAFMQLLVEKGYAQVSIRQVLARAGVSAGSFYEYFASKDALAAVSIRQRVRAIADALAQAVRTAAGLPLPERVDALLEAQLYAPLAEPEQWAALFHLERQVSKPQAFRALYQEFVALWERGLGGGADWPAGAALADAAALRALVRQAVHGYLSLVAPHAYRGCLVL